MNECAAKLSTQPAWVPDWVWSAYGESEHERRGARQLIEAAHAKSVWTALARRLSEDFVRKRHAAVLFNVVHRALDFTGEAVIGSGERRRRALAVIKAASTLAEALNLAYTPDYRTLQLADETAKRARAIVIEQGGYPTPENGDPIHEESFSIGAGMAARGVAFDMQALLAALCKDTLAWSEQAIVERPNKPTAARTYFIRTVTEHFLAGYGEPLRGPTLALASTFFECENMTRADIASLAPAPPRATHDDSRPYVWPPLPWRLKRKADAPD